MKKNIFNLVLILAIIIITKAENADIQLYHLDTDLNKIIKLDDNSILIAGTNGAIIRSSNKGKSWIHNYSGTNCDLYDLVQVNNNSVIVVGAKGTILKSYDRGFNWFVIDSKVQSNLRAVKFFDVNFGIAAGDNGTIIKTRDGGNTWNIIQNVNNTSFRCIFILNQSSYLLAGYDGKIYITDNDGIEWNIINNENEFCDTCKPVQFTISKNNNDIYLLMSNSILFSKDTAKTWKSFNLNISQQWISDVVDNKAFVISRFSNNKYLSIKLIELFEDTIIVNYKQINYDTLHPTYGSQFNSAIKFDDSNYIAIGERKTIQITSNGGKNWMLKSYFTSFQDASYNQLQFLNDSIGFLGSGMSYIFRTKDGGATWLPQIKDTLQYYVMNICGLWFFDEMNGVALTTDLDLLISTKNGGESYESHSINTGIRYNNRLKVFNKKTFFVSGYYSYSSGDKSNFMGRINITNDNGINWNSYSIDSAKIMDAEFLSENTIIGGGIKYDTIFPYIGHSFISKTTDAGANWTSHKFEFLDNINKFYFFNNKVGIMTGYRLNKDTNINKYNFLYMYKTTDGGDNWYQVYTDSTSQPVIGIHFHQDTGYAVGSLNLLLKSTDQGETWLKLVDSLNNYNFRNVWSTGNIIYLNGGSNLFLKGIKKTFNTINENNKVESGPPPIWVYPPFPNPTKHTLKVKLLWAKYVNENDITIKIYNVNGCEIRNVSSNIKEKILDNLAIIEIPTDNLQPGIYYIYFNVNNYSKSVPVVKE